MSRTGFAVLAVLALAGCTSDVASTNGRYGYDRQGYGPYEYDENRWRCGFGGACGSDYGYGHGIDRAGPPVDQQ